MKEIIVPSIPLVASAIYFYWAVKNDKVPQFFKKNSEKNTSAAQQNRMPQFKDSDSNETVRNINKEIEVLFEKYANQPVGQKNSIRVPFESLIQIQRDDIVPIVSEDGTVVVTFVEKKDPVNNKKILLLKKDGEYFDRETGEKVDVQLDEDSESVESINEEEKSFSLDRKMENTDEEYIIPIDNIDYNDNKNMQTKEGETQKSDEQNGFSVADMLLADADDLIEEEVKETQKEKIGKEEQKDLSFLEIKEFYSENFPYLKHSISPFDGQGFIEGHEYFIEKLEADEDDVQKKFFENLIYLNKLPVLPDRSIFIRKKSAAEALAATLSSSKKIQNDLKKELMANDSLLEKYLSFVFKNEYLISDGFVTITVQNKNEVCRMSGVRVSGNIVIHKLGNEIGNFVLSNPRKKVIFANIDTDKYCA